MFVSFSDLPWLPAPPDDFSSQCHAYGLGAGEAGLTAQALSGVRLNASQSARLGRAMARRVGAGEDMAPLSAFRLGVLASFTADLLVDCLPAAAARHGVCADIVSGPYGQVAQAALDPASHLGRGGLDAVLLLIDHRWMELDQPVLSASAADYVAGRIAHLRMVVHALRERTGAPCMLPTLAQPPAPLFGSYDVRVEGSVRAMIATANAAIVALAAETGSYVLDVAALAERIGADHWFDPVQWAAYKLPCNAACHPAYAEMIGRLLGAIRGKARKCLVLDLDNTIWGGAIADDGLEGVRLGQGSAVGEAFLAVQRLALDLRARGVLLAVCSKNDDPIARLPFRQHPDMLLREEHIAVFQANWLDKPSNLEAIARALNIGLEALVFMDDNPAERAQMRAALPSVATPELPGDPNLFAPLLAAAGYFEAVSFSHEDRLRADSYASDARRADVLSTSRNLGDYLSGLDMALTTAPFDKQGRQRIAQLINKTNQFNLTTRRYNEADVAAMEGDPAVFTMQARLQDRFGDLGMIGVIVARQTEGDARMWTIDLWLMSCRVLGRQVEQAMLAQLAKAASVARVAILRACYIPTGKNGMVAQHFDKLGFTLIHEGQDGRRNYEFSIAGYAPPKLPMRVLT